MSPIVLVNVIGHFFCAGCGDVFPSLTATNSSHLVRQPRLSFETSIRGANGVMRINMRQNVLNVVNPC
jgi:hypothetical protein